MVRIEEAVSEPYKKMNKIKESLVESLSNSGLSYSEGYNDPMSGDIRDRIRSRILRRTIATIDHFRYRDNKYQLSLYLEKPGYLGLINTIAETLETKFDDLEITVRR